MHSSLQTNNNISPKPQEDYNIWNIPASCWEPPVSFSEGPRKQDNVAGIEKRKHKGQEKAASRVTAITRFTLMSAILFLVTHT